MATETDSLQTTSRYVNNLLLARSLLRKGEYLDLARPGRDTRAQTINIIHDLILRRDRDRDSREQSALTVQSLQHDLMRKDVEISKLNGELLAKDRTIYKSRVEANNAVAQMQRTELGVKKLQDQLTKLNAMMGHVKAQCAADLKKRDIEMERLKSHLQGQQRGNKALIVPPTMTICGGNGVSVSSKSTSSQACDVHDPEYSLKQESNDFLTRLSASLSDENDNLISLMQTSLKSLKQLLSLEEQSQSKTIFGQLDSGPNDMSSYDFLAREMTTIMDTLRELLTSPNFVAVDEVVLRDEEISRLREGWEMMETRWQDVLHMMNSWRRKMENSGETINLDELRHGLDLGMNFDEVTKSLSPVRQLQSNLSESFMSDDLDARQRYKDSAIGSTYSQQSVGSKSRSSWSARNATPLSLVDSVRRPLTQRDEQHYIDTLHSADNDKENVDTNSTSAIYKSAATRQPSEEDGPEMTLKAKLEHARLEAEVATSAVQKSAVGLPDEKQDISTRLAPPSIKRSGLRAPARRRKSTLSPDEMGSLLGLITPLK